MQQHACGVVNAQALNQSSYRQQIAATRALRGSRTCAGRPMQQHTLDVVDAQALDDTWRQHARGKGSPEDLLELLVQPANAQLLKVELLGLQANIQSRLAARCYR